MKRERCGFFDEREHGYPAPSEGLSISKGIVEDHTGPSLHVISKWFLTNSKIKIEQKTTSRDSSGKTFNAELAKVSFAIDKTDGSKIVFSNQAMIVSELSQDFKDSNLAGILSPQSIIEENQGIRIDLDEQHMLSQLLRNHPLRSQTEARYHIAF